jgi:hypothetical protein
MLPLHHDMVRSFQQDREHELTERARVRLQLETRDERVGAPRLRLLGPVSARPVNVLRGGLSVVGRLAIPGRQRASTRSLSPG